MEEILKIRKEIFIFTILLILSISLKAQYSGGIGTEDNPYQIALLEDLRTLSLTPDDCSKHFILTADIDASDTENWNDGSGFLPIGQYGSSFSGSFNGQDYTISNLFIYRVTGSDAGLFAIIKGALIKDLNLDNFNIEGRILVGSLAGTIKSSGSMTAEIREVSILNCNIKGESHVGGLVGQFSGGMIHDCYVSGKISGSFSIIGGLAGNTSSGYDAEINHCSVIVEVIGALNIGGLVGINQIPITNCQVFVEVSNITALYYGYFGGLASTNIGTISNCYVSGKVVIDGSDYDYIGGIVATNTGTIKNCHTTVKVISADSYYVGGLAGENEKLVKNCYASGVVSGKNCVGGLVGINTHGSQVINCYATGVVTGEDKTGGIVGENSYFGTITNSYASGEVICEEWFSGGFAGLNRSTANTINCFFDNESSGNTIGIGMDHNGQNHQPIGLTTDEFNIQSIFLDADWSFGNTTQSPWKMGTAPDSNYRPVLFYQNYTINFEANEGGIIDPDSLQIQTVNCGSSSEAVQAIPNDGFVFVEWQNHAGDSLTNVNPIVVENVISDSTLIALFASTYGLEETKVRHFKVYPNPAYSVLNIEMLEYFKNKDVTIELIDINGKTVSKLNHVSVSSQIDIQHFDSGLYIVKIQYDKTYITKRIIIQ